MESTKVHIFEHLGRAPYRLIGVLDAGEAYDPDRNPKPGTSCDHCGTYITLIFRCKSSDGKTFVIGSTCVDKLGDAGLRKAVNVKIAERRREARRIKAIEKWEAERPERERREAERQAAEQARNARIIAEWERVKPKLAAQPHPYGFSGKSLLDYINYCFIGSDIAASIQGHRKVRDYMREVGADV
jgi:hypothetical protein